ncbi:MAG TPA: RNA 2',3'-cyclic phosphodiesterase [Candidatus Binataceae bacterium]|nr:RNA 2',3'-cyclic phosphodiesterase [Candidatus Binataceae bacterium]
MSVRWSEGGGARMHSRDDFPPHDAESVRAFIAVRMSARVEDEIAGAISELARASEGVKWVRRENLHVTLKFLGAAVNPRKLEPLAEALHDVAASTTEFDTLARGAGGFPNLDRPRVVWVGLHGVEPGTLAALASRVEGAAADCGFERERKRWTGHLTIGRVRDDRHVGGLRAAATAMRDREFGISKIESLTLYRSHLGDQVSRYEPLATFLLKHRD